MINEEEVTEQEEIEMEVQRRVNMITEENRRKEERENNTRETEEKKEQPLGDIYDVYGMASSVHSRTTDMTRDYTLAKYNSRMINEKFPRFIREQRKVVRILKSFMVIPIAKLERRFGVEQAKRYHAYIKECFNEIKKLLLGEVDEMVIMSRAGKGDVITAMLMHSKDQEAQEEYERTIEGQDIASKLKERK